MFNITKTKEEIEKTKQGQRAIPAILAIPDPENSTNSTNSTKSHPKINISADDLAKVNQWLDYIVEDDPETRKDVLDQCRTPDGLKYFLLRYHWDIEKDREAGHQLYPQQISKP